MLEQREYPTRVIDRTLAAVDQGHRSILIEAACSAGKTVMAHVIAQRLYERHGWTAGWTATGDGVIRRSWGRPTCRHT